MNLNVNLNNVAVLSCCSQREEGDLGMGRVGPKGDK